MTTANESQQRSSCLTSIDPSQQYPHRKHEFVEANQYFLLPPQPAPKDRRPRNAFGFLTGFGKAAAAYYRKRNLTKAKSKKNKL